MMVVIARTAEARKALRDLNIDLPESSQRSGRPLSWTAAARLILDSSRPTSTGASTSPRLLRHSAAVTWLDSSVHIRACADLLWHSSIAVTGDVYGHTSDSTARSAVDALADQLGI